MLIKRQLSHKYILKALRSLSTLCLSIVMFAILLSITTPTEECLALTPSEIIVIANRNVEESVPLAQFYMKSRGIPPQNLVIISSTDKERCNREEYDNKIAQPVRLFLHKQDPRKISFRCILTMYGVPLTIDDDGLSTEQKATWKELIEKASKSRESLKQLPKEEKEKIKILTGEIENINKQISALRALDRTAAVDSELALIDEKTYPLAWWVPNPFFLGYKGQQVKNMPLKAFFIARLDGPSPEIVRRIIKDSLATEKKGLRGKAYFDARWPDPGNKKLSSYAFYDRALHRTADLR